MKNPRLALTHWTLPRNLLRDFPLPQLPLMPPLLHDRLLRFLALLVVLTSGLLVRVRLLPDQLIGGHLYLTSGDSWYHLRRMAFAAQNPLNLPTFDPWTHFPKGMLLTWPPLFDLLGGLMTRLLGGDGRDLDGVAMGGIALCLVLTALTLWLTFAIAQRLAGVLAGLSAGLIVAFLPGHQNYTHTGKIDHHVIEPLLTFAILHLLLLAAHHRQLPGRLLRAGLAAILLAAALETWPSSSLAILLLATCSGVLLLTAKDDFLLRRHYLTVILLTLGGAGLLGLPLAWLSPHGRLGLTVSAALSWFQPGLLLCLAAGLWVMGRTLGDGIRSKFRGILLGALMTLALLLTWPGGRNALLGGSEFVHGQGFIVLANESMGALENGLWPTLSFFSPFYALVPLLLYWLLRHRRDRPELLVWGTALLLVSLLAFQQLRFVVLLSLPLAVLTGVGLVALVDRVRASHLQVALVLAGALGLLLPGVWTVTHGELPLAKRAAVWTALDWLAHRAPPDGDPQNPDTKPTYAVLAPWGYGHELLVLGHHANVASPFIAPNETEGLETALRFALTTDPQEAEKLLKKHKVRYVIVAPLAQTAMRAYAQALGENPDRYAVVHSGGTQLTETGHFAAGQTLLRDNGAGDGQQHPPWDFLQLVLDVNGQAKIFEFKPLALAQE